MERWLFALIVTEGAEGPKGGVDNQTMIKNIQ